MNFLSTIRGLLIGLSFIATGALAWTGPNSGATAPEGNMPPPLTAGASQIKTGILTVGGLGATNLTVGSYISTVSFHIHDLFHLETGLPFGATAGYVLTATDAGNGTWQALPGRVLPDSGRWEAVYRNTGELITYSDNYPWQISSTSSYIPSGIAPLFNKSPYPYYGRDGGMCDLIQDYYHETSDPARDAYEFTIDNSNSIVANNPPAKLPILQYSGPTNADGSWTCNRYFDRGYAGVLVYKLVGIRVLPKK